MSVYIGIGVVEHIVLHLPVVNIAGQDIHAAAHYLVNPFLGGIGTVVGIVHYVHSNTCHPNAHDNGEKKLYPAREV